MLLLANQSQPVPLRVPFLVPLDLHAVGVVIAVNLAPEVSGRRQTG